MLFLFEAAFFLLAVFTLVVAEVSGRSEALVFWSALTVVSWLARSLVQGHVEGGPVRDAANARWRRLVADNWRHFNKLLILGLLALTAWWWLGFATATVIGGS